MGRRLKETMERGELVATETVSELLAVAMIRASLGGGGSGRGNRGFLIDGYPRELQQGIAFEEFVCPARLCLYFKAGDETMLKRMRKRAETSGRDDDNEATMRERLKTFRRHADPVLDLFRNAGKLIEIEAEGEADAVFRDTVDALRDFLLADAWTCFVIGAPKSGRTTQSRKLEAALKTARVGWEELAKAEMDKGTKLGKSLEKKKRKGIAVTKTTVLTMIKVVRHIEEKRGTEKLLSRRISLPQE